ncbi:MFS transporter [Streptomyces sp. NPDC001941]|uniref:MFS transporter n=1 Tax=Streptomyces sp. NPDC001941 TaxID=3154659 RepID=UPI00331F1163
MAGFTICRSGCVVVPFLSLFLVRQQHFGPAEAAQVSAAFGAGWAIGPAIAGWLADHMGRRATLLLALAAVTATYLLLPALHSLSTLTGAAFGVGLFFDGPRPAVLALVADLVPEQARGRAYARLYWASNLGAGLAGCVGTALSERHMHVLFYVAAASNSAFALIILIRRIGAGHHPTKHHVHPGPGTGGYHSMIRDRRFLALVGLTLVYLCCYQQVLFGLPVAMEYEGLSPTGYGFINLLNAIGVVAFQPLLQAWITRRTPLVVCATGAIVLGLGMGGNLGARQSLIGYALAASVWTLGEVLFFSSVMTAVERLTPAAGRGRYTGVWASTMGVSSLIAPLISSTALDAGGTELMWMMSGALGAIAAIGFLVLQKRIDTTTFATGDSEPPVTPART